MPAPKQQQEAYTVLRDLQFRTLSGTQKAYAFQAQILISAMKTPELEVSADEIPRDLQAIYTPADQLLPSRGFKSLADPAFLQATDELRKSARRTRSGNWTTVWWVIDRRAALTYAAINTRKFSHQ